MSTPDPFEQLLQKAFTQQALPPVPPRLLARWQTKPASRLNPWLWLMPGLIFSIGLLLGVVLAPMGLSAALAAFKSAMMNIAALLPAGALVWALALLLATTVLMLDSLRSRWQRMR